MPGGGLTGGFIEPEEQQTKYVNRLTAACSVYSGVATSP